MSSASALLLDGLEPLLRQPLPERAATAARLRLLDTMGCLIAGAAMIQDQGKRIMELSGSVAGGGPARLVGFDCTTDTPTAALINGLSAHMAELDDGHRYGIVHTGAVLLPALVAIGHSPRVSDESFMRGIVVGYEAAIRIAQTLQPQAKDLGWHGTGIFGAMGAAMGVAAALGANRSEMNAALSAGATSASGLLNVIRGQSELKPFNSAQAAQAGLSAAITALSGFRGSDDVLGGFQGFLDIMGGTPDMDFSSLTVKAPYCVETVYLKPYASCRYAHAPVESVQKLQAEHDIAVDDIADITVHTFRWAVFQHDHTEITGISSAKMSVPYCVAAALRTGRTGMAAFDDSMLKDPEILRLTKRVAVVEDPEMSALVPKKRPAKVTLTLRDGRQISARTDLPKGEPETAMSAQELRDKFIDLAVFGNKSRAQAEKMAEMILDPAASKLALLDML